MRPVATHSRPCGADQSCGFPPSGSPFPGLPARSPVPGSLAGPGPVVSRNAPPLPRRARTAPPSRRLFAVPVPGSPFPATRLPFWQVPAVAVVQFFTLHSALCILHCPQYGRPSRFHVGCEKNNVVSHFAEMRLTSNPTPQKPIKKASKSAKIDQKRAKSIKNARLSCYPS